MRDNMLTDDDNQTYFVVQVHGNPVGIKHLTPQAAENALMQLSEEHQSIAEIVPVTESGKQVLLG